jgi:thiamine biosynthesis protein ThiS
MPENPGIQVSVNGEPVRVPSGSTLAELLETLKVDRGRVAVEHNRRVVPRAEHASLRLNHGDRLEIVTFVGGGSPGQGSGDPAAVLTSPAWSPIR